MNFKIITKMKKVSFLLPCLFFFFLILTTQQSCTESKTNLLVKVDVTQSVDQIGLPVYAHLQGAAGQDYALVIASESELVDSGMSYEILDSDVDASSETSYLIALERITGARASAAKDLNVLHDDGRNIVVRVSELGAASLSKMGFEIEWLSESPIVFPEIDDLLYLEEATRGSGCHPHQSH